MEIPARGIGRNGYDGTFYDPRVLAVSGSRGLTRSAQTLEERAAALHRASKKQRMLKVKEATPA